MAEYKIHNRMTHWQKTYPAWISFAAIAFLLAVWEIICRPDFLIVSTGTKRNPYCTRQAYYKRRNQPQSDSQSLPHSAGLCFRQHHRFAGRARHRHLCADGPNRNTDRQCPLSDPKNRFTAAFYSLAWNR